MGGRIANPSGANALLQGGLSAAGQNQFAANAYNPFAESLISASRNPSLQRGLSPYVNAQRASNQYGAENVYGYGGRGTVPTTIDFNTGFD